MSRCRRLTLAGALFASSACDGGGTDTDGQSLARELVYGADDRQELYSAPVGDPLASLARTSLLALGRASEVQTVQPGPFGEAVIRLTSPSVRERLGLCEGERFGDQPAFAFCSGFPVAPHLVLTAGHCLNVLGLDELVLLTGFYEAEPGVVAPLVGKQIHAIEELVAHDPWRDVALLRVSGAALEPLRLAPSLPEPGAPLSSVNHGMGAPAKRVSGAKTYALGEASFVSDLDAFGGASGAPVFDGENEVLGILTSGLPDYDATEAGCLTTRHETGGGLVANELVEHAQSVVDDFCAMRSIPELCGAEHASPASSCAMTSAARRPWSDWWAAALGCAAVFGGVRRRRAG